VLGATDQVRGHAGLRRETLAARLVTHQLDGADQTDAARVADQRMRGVAPDRRLQPGTDAPHRAYDVALGIDLQRLQRDGGRNRMRRIGITMAEDAELVALREQNVV